MGDHYPECERYNINRDGLPCICELLIEFGDRAAAYERGRIAQEIGKAEREATIMWRMTRDAYWEGQSDALEYAERIARGGEETSSQ